MIEPTIIYSQPATIGPSGIVGSASRWNIVSPAPPNFSQRLTEPCASDLGQAEYQASLSAILLSLGPIAPRHFIDTSQTRPTST